MLTKNKKIKKVNGLGSSDIALIEAFLQGLVYCWCKNRKNEWFALRDLVGKENSDWTGTPLKLLYEKHVKMKKAYPAKDAGIDAGWLLKKVISDDERPFDTKKAHMTRKYRWID